ncbi:hypothetical protein BJX66DRAFT_93530 [Aspergillus keveii]|uniref:Uncharacterized protein n=1 Tax=Aspergillus keveii TaxID=714993 RepID=A0ABR4GEU1_9EURO
MLRQCASLLAAWPDKEILILASNLLLGLNPAAAPRRLSHSRIRFAALHRKTNVNYDDIAFTDIASPTCPPR